MASRDENFICGKCGDILLPIGKNKEGTTIYQCRICHHGQQIECLERHNPRTIFVMLGDKKLVLFAQEANKTKNGVRKRNPVLLYSY